MGHSLITTLSISLVWIIYSAIPPLLLVVYRFMGRGALLSWLCWTCFLVSSACGFLAILLLWNVYPAEVGASSNPYSLSASVSHSCFMGSCVLWSCIPGSSSARACPRIGPELQLLKASLAAEPCSSCHQDHRWH